MSLAVARTTKENQNTRTSRLEIGQPGDMYEREADAVADKVAGKGTSGNPSSGGTIIQRMQEDGVMQMQPMEEEEEMMQMQPKGGFLQMQAREQVNDMQMAVRNPSGVRAGELKTKCNACEKEEKLQKKPAIQRSANGKPQASSAIAKKINASRGNGQSLPSEVNSEMSNKIGADFSSVNIHTDDTAVRMSSDLGANAFTVGNDVYFNKGKYNPSSSDGKHLLAHELTHTVQQGAANKMIQKDGEEPEVAEATETDRREFVREAIRYLESAGTFFEQATIDVATLDRVLQGWQSTVTNSENIINTSLNADVALLQNLRQAYTAALRIIMSRASAQLNVPLIRLYLQKMHLIPEWAWPGTSDFTLSTEADKRAFIQATIDAFNDVATLSGYTTYTDATLRDILTRLKNLVNDQLEIITGDLGNDQTLRTNLHNAYQATLNTVLTAAAPQMGQSVTQLSLQYMDLVPEGMETYLAGTSTQIPLGATPNASGDVVFMLNGIEITIKPDGTRSGAGAETTITPHLGIISWQSSGGNISSFTGPAAQPAFDIQTKYNAQVPPSSNSAYGRGTTQTDQERGNTSLGFHESRHGLDFVRYMRDHAPPASFAGAVGDPVAAFQTEMTRWQTEWQDYINDMNSTSLANTDCVGTTLDQHNAAQGNITHECP